MFSVSRQRAREAPLHPTRDLYRWTTAWYEKAVELGFLQPPYQPDDANAWRLLGYFSAGLTPVEAVLALFGLKH